MDLFEKKYQIFISSTYTDLIKVRDEVIKALLSMYHIPIGMEMFSADNDEQWETIKKTIDNSDYYILIIGHRYGTMTNENISYTQKEYYYARSIKIPVYAYIRDSDVPTYPFERDSDVERNAKLNEFKEIVKSKSLVEFWVDFNDLTKKISIALSKAFVAKPRIGWIRGNLNNLTELNAEFNRLKEQNLKLINIVTQVDQLYKVLPSITILFNDEQKIDLSLSNKHYATNLIRRATHERPEKLPNEALQYYSHENVERFNEWFDQNIKHIENYNNNLIILERGRLNLKRVKLKIINRGLLKASNLKISIKFPESVFVSRATSHSHSFERNSSVLDNIPKHPVVAALELYNRYSGINGMPSWVTKEFNYIFERSFQHPEVIDVHDISFEINEISNEQYLSSKNNISFIVMPKKVGYFYFTVKIFCDEYTSSVEYQLPIEILQGD